MSRDDDEAERGRAEPIDVEYEPAYRDDDRRGGGIGGGTALALAVLAAGVGAAGGAIAPRLPAVQAALNDVAPLQATSVNGAEAPANVTELDQRLDARDVGADDRWHAR